MTPALPELANRKYIVMVGAMNYFPNSDGAVWFAREVFPQIRSAAPDVEFLIVGHSPLSSVQRLASLPGVTVTGYVPDVRPFIAQSITTVTPLRIARGVQNKVLEALGMGKTVLASAEIARTFGALLPDGLCVCGTPEEYTHEVVRRVSEPPGFDPAIREATRRRFSWEQKLEAFDEELRFTIGDIGSHVTL
jgi:glycosyltransferase involved in cell wall biosynthesis